MSTTIKPRSKHIIVVCALALIVALCACNFPSQLAAEAITASPTVTLTAGPGTVYPTWTVPALTSSAGTDAATPTLAETSFTLPPTPGRTPTELSSPNAPHITNTPGAGDAYIESFTASPTDVDPGGSVTLSWKAGGDSFSLFTVDAQGRLNQGTPVAAQGSTAVTVDPSLRNLAEFMLSATARGTTVTAIVKVTLHCVDAWFFSNPPTTCPSGPATVSEGASEHFQHGWMLWVGSTQTIYVLYDKGSPRWRTYTNSWQDGMLEYDPNIIPPSGLYQPVRGFGLLWRTESAGKSNSPRNRLDWATEPESSFSIAVQCDSLNDSNCYLKEPSGGTLWLKPNSSNWTEWNGP